MEDNIEAVVSLAGTHLGVAKSMTAFLSGEMKDTVEMNPAGAYGTCSFLQLATPDTNNCTSTTLIEPPSPREILLS